MQKRRNIVVAAGIGALIAGAVFFVYGLIAEVTFLPLLRQPNAPFLSYGQQSFVSLIMVMWLGASIALVPLIVSFPKSAQFVMLAIPMLSAAFVYIFASSAWQNSIKLYGRDPSDLIVFVPLYVASAVAATAAIIGAIVSTVYLRRERTKSHESRIDRQ